MTVSDESTAFAVTADAGVFGAQADALVRSIRRHHPDALIIVFVPESNAGAMDAERMRSLSETASVKIGPTPDPSYLITAQLRAFELAAEREDVEQIVMLDTDILLLDSLSFPEPPVELSARPCTLRGSFWTSERAVPVWEQLYDRYGLNAPASRVSAVLGGDLPYPFYNSAVVMTRDRSFPSRLLQRTLDIREAARDPVLSAADSDTPLFYSDQVALSLLVQESAFGGLDLSNNYPVPAFLRVPSSTAGLHYGSPVFLGTALSPAQREAYDDVLSVGPSVSGWGQRLLSAAWFRVANRIPYGVQTELRRLAGSRHAP